MAVKQSSKLHVYDSLSRINWAFTAINRHLHRVEHSGMFSIYKMNVLRGLARELQSHISHEITDKMHEVEDEEWFRWGQVKIAWEHHLNPDKLPFKNTRQ
jgi:hypothetical protein